MRVERIIFPFIHKRRKCRTVREFVLLGRKSQHFQNGFVGILICKERKEFPITSPLRQIMNKILSFFVGWVFFSRIKHQLQPQEGFFITLFRNHLFGNEHRNIEEQFPVIHGVRTAPYKIYHGCGIRSIDISLVRPVIVAENGLAQVPRLPITRHIIAKVNTEIVIIIRVGVIVAVRNRQSLRFAGIEPFCSTIAITLVEVIYQGMR